MKVEWKMGKDVTKGLIFNIQGYAIHDGPGIRTTVFFKGCPLTCVWCANPESQKSYPEIFHNRNKCVTCYRCTVTCPNGAVSVSQQGDFPTIDRGICRSCGDRPCVAECYESALELSGYLVTVDELVDEILKDVPFYESSGGGVTFSGGEPTSQPEFLLEMLKRCREQGIHTNLDTCGQCSWETLEKLLDYLNLIFFDLKIIDDSKHREYIGVSNKLILSNAERIIATGKVPMVIRVPIIPGYNDSPADLKELGCVVRNIGAKEVNILSYHGMAASKYEKLGLVYGLTDLPMPTKEAMEEIKALFEAMDLVCSIQ